MYTYNDAKGERNRKIEHDEKETDTLMLDGTQTHTMLTKCIFQTTAFCLYVMPQVFLVICQIIGVHSVCNARLQDAKRLTLSCATT